MHVHDEIREHILFITKTMYADIATIQKWNWNKKFEHYATAFSKNERERAKIRKFINLCKNRMVQGYFRYGDMWCIQKYNEKKQIKYCKHIAQSIIKRLLEYKKEPNKNNPSNRNQEHLIDAWNLIMVLFTTMDAEKPLCTRINKSKEQIARSINNAATSVFRGYACHQHFDELLCMPETTYLLIDAAVLCGEEYVSPSFSNVHMTSIESHKFHIAHKEK